MSAWSQETGIGHVEKLTVNALIMLYWKNRRGEEEGEEVGVDEGNDKHPIILVQCSLLVEMIHWL